MQYLIWFSGVLRGDFGWSFDFQEPVSGLINERIALLLMYFGFQFFGADVGGLFSAEYINARWSLAKLLDLLQAPLGAGDRARHRRHRRDHPGDARHPARRVAQAVRDHRPRQGGARDRSDHQVPARVALNPIVSTVGWLLPEIISGAAIVSVVLSLPTTGQLLLRALRTQDMYLAGSLILLLSFLTVIGTLISDVLLAAIDPRIRMQS